ncbi:MAG: hypothetical protein EOM25_03400 [Deltaproteobacteria bacterium]|nr:hypothetical protein [Deltaproteobacteria bacterium]
MTLALEEAQVDDVMIRTGMYAFAVAGSVAKHMGPLRVHAREGSGLLVATADGSLDSNAKGC